MNPLSAPIQDLGLILAAAGVVTLLFKRFNQPVVLGYIIVGYLVGPHFPFFPPISDPTNVKVWAEIGVIFLLFGLGLEFSFKKLLNVGGAASITALTEVSFMIILGFLSGRFIFGWSTMDSLFLGGIISISSTSIIMRAFEELNVKGRGFVPLVFGILIVEDLIAVLLLVLLSTIAIGQSNSSSELIFAIVKLACFLGVWFIVGIVLIPTFFNHLRTHLNAETLLVVSLGICFLTVTSSTKLGFSSALGAFVTGSILAETSEAKRISRLIEPVKNLFAAIFFVSIGILIDPSILRANIFPILTITIITILGKCIGTTVGVLFSQRSLRHAIQSGLSIAQIGEFSFIIAVLGLSLNVTSDFLYPVAVGVSALTAFTTPYMIKSADPILEYLEKHLSVSWKHRLKNIQVTSPKIASPSHRSATVRSHAIRIVVNTLIVIGIFVTIGQSLGPYLLDRGLDPQWVKIIEISLAVLGSAPFFGAVFIGGSKHRERNQIGKLYDTLERRFFKNLDTGGEDPKIHALAPWDAHLASLEVEPSSPVVGKSLERLKIRETYGVTIALIERGRERIAAPYKDDVLFPLDKIFVIGTDEQILKFKEQLEARKNSHPVKAELEVVLNAHLIGNISPYLGKSIRESGIREKSHGLIVGVERSGNRILNPDSNLVIEPGDLLWIVGERNALKGL